MLVAMRLRRWAVPEVAVVLMKPVHCWVICGKRGGTTGGLCHQCDGAGHHQGSCCTAAAICTCGQAAGGAQLKLPNMQASHLGQWVLTWDRISSMSVELCQPGSDK